ncbi:hypothetical protein D3C73_1625770 [compost metagenome]
MVDQLTAVLDTEAAVAVATGPFKVNVCLTKFAVSARTSLHPVAVSVSLTA